jgi:hypothetical protein
MNKKTDTLTFNTPWREFDVPADQPLFLKIGPLKMWIISEHKELRMAWKRVDENSGESNSETEPDLSEWHRWAFKNKNPKIRLNPVLPDRPVLIIPENSFKIIEDASVRIFVRIPVWLRITITGKPDTQLIEIPIIVLSNTWFGNFLAGDLCYGISSGSRLSIMPDYSRPYMAICPLKLVDKAPEDLNVGKICLRVEHLTLFYGAGQLWSSETVMTYRGDSEISETRYDSHAPPEADSAKLLTAPRNPVSKSIAARTFSTIKELPGFGSFIKG